MVDLNHGNQAGQEHHRWLRQEPRLVGNAFKWSEKGGYAGAKKVVKVTETAKALGFTSEGEQSGGSPSGSVVSSSQVLVNAQGVRHVLEDAIAIAHSRGEITYLDRCELMNEVEVAPSRHPRFNVGDTVAVSADRGTVVKVEDKVVTVKFDSLPVAENRERKLVPNSGSLYGVVFTKRFKACSDGTWRNGQLKGTLVAVQSAGTSSHA